MASSCPIDAKALSLTQSERMEAMSCAACGGTWLSANSAGALLTRLASGAPLERKFFDRVRRESSESKLSCLECRTTMRTVSHRGVEIDVCQDCGGIWFDGGELQRFRQFGFSKPARVAAAAAGATALAAAGVAGAAAMNGTQPPPQAESLASSVGDLVGSVAIDGVVEVVGDVAGSVISGILEAIFS